jgi:hypothetical protein
MSDRPSRPFGKETIALLVGAFILVFVFLTWAPWNPQHVASNPGPSGTPGSTIVERTPPPAPGPSQDPATTGQAR